MAMVSLCDVEPGKLKETPPGALFIAADGGEHFLAGWKNDYSVLVKLTGDRPFLFNGPSNWPNSSGTLLPGVRFQIDPTSAISIPSPSNAPPGTVVLGHSGTMIIAEGNEGTRAILVACNSGPMSLDGGDVAFAAWRLVTGDPDTFTVHFEHLAGVERRASD